MKIRYDESSDALYIKLKNSKYRESEEISNNIILDYDRGGNVIGIEILDASTYINIEELSSVKFEVNKVISKV